MKIKKLSKILNKLDPEGEVSFHVTEQSEQSKNKNTGYIAEIIKITTIPGYKTRRLTDIEICLKIDV